MRTILVHGISTDGEEDIFQLKNYITDPFCFKYGPINAWEARDLKYLQSVAFRLKSLIDNLKDEEINLIGHSNGCRVILRALELGAKVKKVIFFSPAVENWKMIPFGSCEKAFIVHYPKDKAILYGSLLIGHPFGSMGRVGYKGPRNDHTINIEASPMKSSVWYKQHSGYFTGEDLKSTVDMVNNLLN